MLRSAKSLGTHEGRSQKIIMILKEPIRKFPNGTRVVCRVPKHPSLTVHGVVTGFTGCWGSKNTWYDILDGRAKHVFYGSFVKKAKGD